MLKVTDIPAPQWVKFCEEFSQQHRGWLVTTSIRVQGKPGPGDEAEPAQIHLTARDLPFAGLQALENSQGLNLLLGDGKFRIHEHIREVTSLHLLETMEGAHAGLRIDKGNGNSLLLNFRVHAPPESVDGRMGR